MLECSKIIVLDFENLLTLFVMLLNYEFILKIIMMSVLNNWFAKFWKCNNKLSLAY